jgi:biopolymer transport protein ExbB
LRVGDSALDGATLGGAALWREDAIVDEAAPIDAQAAAAADPVTALSVADPLAAATVADPLMAAAAAGPLTAAAKFLVRGGPAIWAIALLSVATLALIMWKAMAFARLGVWRRARTAPSPCGAAAPPPPR